MRGETDANRWCQSHDPGSDRTTRDEGDHLARSAVRLDFEKEVRASLMSFFSWSVLRMHRERQTQTIHVSQ